MPEYHFDTNTTRLSAPVWNMMPFEERPWLVIEQRDDNKRQVSFSLFDYESNQFIWKDVKLPEKWWVNLAGIAADHVVLNVFESSDNPDKTHFVFLDSLEGKEVIVPEQQIIWSHTKDAQYPFQYLDGETDFDTVKEFLRAKLEVVPRLAVEYLEYGNYIIISYYTGQPAAYVNHLSIFKRDGEPCSQDEIGTNLKGIGTNTFFITSGYLLFVKNKTDLVTFRIV